MERIAILGNSGSGKTYLASQLSEQFGYLPIHLDELFWEPGGFSIKRPKEILHAEIAQLSQSQTWIVEGVFGELVKEFLPYANYLIWLDLDWETCSANLFQRGSQSDGQLDQQSAEESYQKLLIWASEYWQRDGLRSHRGHQLLFDQFKGDKIRLNTTGSVDDFIAHLPDV